MAISEEIVFLQLPKNLKDQIRAEAKRKHLSMSSLIRLAVGEWLEEHSKGKR